MKILVVEDEKPIRDWLVYILNSIGGHEVSEASNGKEGYNIAINIMPDVIFTDIKMPIMDGIEFTREIKKSIRGVNVIILSNFEEFSYAKEAISLGVLEYLVKSDIRQKDIEKVLDKIENKEKEQSLEKKEIRGGYSKIIDKAINYIDKNYKEQITLTDVANHVYISNEYLSRLFKEEVGENFISYITTLRLEKGRMLLRNTDKKISDIAESVGYSNVSYFSKSYKKYFEINPEKDRY